MARVLLTLFDGQGDWMSEDEFEDESLVEVVVAAARAGYKTGRDFHVTEADGVPTMYWIGRPRPDPRPDLHPDYVRLFTDDGVDDAVLRELVTCRVDRRAG